MKNFDETVDAHAADFEKKAITSLEENGVVVITSLVDQSIVDEICKDANEVLSQPSTRGSFGYISKDPHKRMYDGFLFSKNTINTVSNPKIISLIELYLQQEVVMTECFLKKDLGTNISYFPYHRHTGSDLNTDDDVTKRTNNKFGCGVIFYLHDTSDGAFCYAPGSHKTPMDTKIYLLNQDPNKDAINQKLRRIVGPKGSVVIFNEAGWHGPEQPVTTPRTVILSGYQSRIYSDNKTRTEIPILISNIHSLSAVQKRAIGFSSGSRSDFKDYHMRKGKLSSLDKLFNAGTEALFKLKRMKHAIK